MNWIEHEVAELVRMAETPLYSLLSWMKRELGLRLTIESSLEIARSMDDHRHLVLWRVRHGQRERVDVFPSIPELARDYWRLAAGEDYDPLGYSVSLAKDISLDDPPDWSADFDFEAETVELRSNGPGIEEILEQLRPWQPDVTIRVVQERVEGQSVLWRGTLAIGHAPDTPS